VPPGTYVGKLEVRAGARQAAFALRVRVLDFVLPDLPEGSFYMNIWQDPAAVARWAKVPVWSEAHWKLLEVYARDLAAQGRRVVAERFRIERMAQDALRVFEKARSRFAV
jgi:hypothetical protein